MKQNYSLRNNSKFLFLGLLFIIFSPVVFGQEGSLDTGFNPEPGFNSDVFSTAVQNDGKIVVVGNFSNDNGGFGNRIARLNADGTPDSSFNTGTGLGNDARSVALQPDGKIIVVGESTTFNGTTRNRIVRLNTNGSIDTSFDPGIGFNFYALHVMVQPDGKILVVGGFTGTSRNYIARLNADGTLDSTFTTGTGFNNIVYHAALQNDGKIVVGGNFSSFNGMSRAKIARLNSDGTLDTTFNSGTTGFNNFVFSVSMQTDDKIIVGGWFTAYNGTSRRHIARLNADGTLDTTFNPGNGFSSNVYATKIQQDGKILVAGDFTSFAGTTRNNIARLNTNGTLDTSFNVGTAFNSYVRTLTIQPDGKIIAGGNFTTYNGTTRTRLARLNGTPLSIAENKMLSFDYYPNPTKGNLFIKTDTSIDRITISNLVGQEIKTVLVSSNQVNLSLDDFPAALYFIKIESNDKSESFKVIKE